MSDPLTFNPQINYMEQGKRPPLSTPDTIRNMNSISNSNLEEGKGFYSMNRPSSPYSYPSNITNENPNPTVWEKVKKSLGLGGKRRFKTRKMIKSKKSRKSKKKSKKSRKSKKSIYRRQRGGIIKKTFLFDGLNSNGQYGGNIIVNPYSPPMDFAPVKDIPTAQPHNWVG
jgi:hypothetical protein